MAEPEPSDVVSPPVSLSRPVLGGLTVLGLLVVALWVFPSVWYTRSDSSAPRLWFHERGEIAGWEFKEIPVAERAERILVADDLFSGVFTRKSDRAVVSTFAARRYSEKRDEIGLFMHTPDRCWTDGGWSLDPVVPEVVEFSVNGVPMRFERRVFSQPNGHRELTYFGGLVGGRPVPYRLDHNLSIGMKRALRKTAGEKESLVRAADTRFWGRIWQGLVERNPLVGPKQFVRLSTELKGADFEAADRLLKEFLSEWLEPVAYEEELEKALNRKP